MSNRMFRYSTAAILVGILGQLIWSIAFWDSELFMFHWVFLPVAIAIFSYGAIKDGRNYDE